MKHSIYIITFCFLQRYTDPQEGEIAQQLLESRVGDQKVGMQGIITCMSLDELFATGIKIFDW